jgi:hypothetical protein
MSGYWFWVLAALVAVGGGAYLHFRFPPGSRARNRLKWSLRGIVLLFVVGFLHYTLPQRDIVRITNTYNRLTTVSWENSWAYASPDLGTAEGVETRDIRFIEAAFPNGKVIVYRNEDTGWFWPPYFKYDSSNLHAEAANVKSTETAPKWVAVTHYGWRIPWLSIYPNAVKVRVVEGPDVRLVPWLNALILLALAVVALMVRRIWLQFRERTVDPIVAEAADVLDGIDARADDARATARGWWGRLMAWLGTWRKKS